jgi:hypothetical protein
MNTQGSRNGCLLYVETLREIALSPTLPFQETRHPNPDHNKHTLGHQLPAVSILRHQLDVSSVASSVA